MNSKRKESYPSAYILLYSSYHFYNRDLQLRDKSVASTENRRYNVTGTSNRIHLPIPISAEERQAGNDSIREI